MDLDIRTRGRAPSLLEVTAVRPIEEEDLRALALPRPSGQPTALKRLRDRHHRLAQLLARGETERDAAIICGYDLSRVSILKSDPAFRELLEFYRARVDEKFDQFGDKLAAVANDAIDLIRERLEEEPEKIPVNQLLQIAQMGADRTGYGPRSESVNVNVGLADTLSEARKRVAERRMRVIEDAGKTD